jgi:hypothetical protein
LKFDFAIFLIAAKVINTPTIGENYPKNGQNTKICRSDNTRGANVGARRDSSTTSTRKGRLLGATRGAGAENPGFYGRLCKHGAQDGANFGGLNVCQGNSLHAQCFQSVAQLRQSFAQGAEVDG